MSRQEMTYAGRESVKYALDVLETSRADTQIDRNLRSASDTVEGMLRRRFYPELATRKFDWPNTQYARPWRLWLDRNELISVDTFTAGGTVISSSDFILRRSDNLDEPPYDHIEIDLSSSAAFSAGNTYQQSLEIVGLFGYNDEQSPAGALSGGINDSVTTLECTNGSLIEIGNLLTIEDERLVATERNFVDSAVNLSSDASASTSTVTVGDGSVFNINEVILINSERMIITAIAGNNLTVKRAWDGSTLSSHTSGDDVFVSRTITVIRGALGSTAASHSDTTSITRLSVPPLVEDLTVAEAMVTLLQQRTGMARTVGSADAEKEHRGAGLADIRKRATEEYRRMRIGAI